MRYTMTTPCDQCPFLKKMKRGFTLRRLEEMACGEFHCHQTGDCDDDASEYVANSKSVHCAGALIYNEKRKLPHQMMRIVRRIGLYDPSKLDMKADVR